MSVPKSEDSLTFLRFSPDCQRELAALVAGVLVDLVADDLVADDLVADDLVADEDG